MADALEQPAQRPDAGQDEVYRDWLLWVRDLIERGERASGGQGTRRPGEKKGEPAAAK
jgi:hypothetical protein